MNWDYDGRGQWSANSSLTDDGGCFEWLVCICEDGTFSVSDPSAELTDREETFDTLRDAKSWCEETESAMVRSYQREQLVSDIFAQESFDLGVEFAKMCHTMNCFTNANGCQLRRANVDRIKAEAKRRSMVVYVARVLDDTWCEISWKPVENTDI